MTAVRARLIVPFMLLYLAGLTATAAADAGQTALALAASPDPAARPALLRMLRDPASLAVLAAAPGPPVARRAPPSTLSAVFRALAANPAPDARAALLTLIRDRGFLRQADNTRGAVVTDLLRATAAIEAPPPDLVTFWRDHAKPDDGYVNVTVEVLAANGGPPALDLLAKLLADSRFAIDDRNAWLWSAVLPRRLDPALAERLGAAASAWPEPLRLVLLEVLFNPAPRPDAPPGAGLSVAPPLTAATPEATAVLRKVAALPWVAAAPLAARRTVAAGLGLLPKS